MTQFSWNTKADFRPPPAVGSESAAGAAPGLDAPRRNPLESIWNRRWIVVSTMLLLAAVGIVKLLLTDKVYQATARLTVERSGPRVVNNDPSEVSGQTQNYLNTQCEVIRSRNFLAEMVRRAPEIASLETFKGHTYDVPGYIKSIVGASVGRRDDIITVAVRSTVREDAANLANAIVGAYEDEQKSQKISSVKQVIDFYKAEKARVDKDLELARSRKLKFQKDYAELSLGAERNSPMLERLARLGSALTETQLQRLNAQAAIDSTKAMAADPIKIRQLLGSREFKNENAELRRQMRELQQRFAAVGKTYLANFPDVGVLQTSIKSLEDELQLEDKRVFDAYVAELDARLITIKNNEAALQMFLNEAKSEAMRQYSNAAEFAIVQAEYDSLEKYNSDLAMRIRELSPLSDEALVNVKIVESARLQDTPQVEPDVQATLFMSLAGGLVLGALLAFLRDLLDQRLRSADEIKQVTGLPILGVVPHIQHVKTAALRGQQLHVDPMGEVAESYRTIRTAIYFGSPAGAVRTILITSPAPGEGKSTLASNLAIAMAQAGNQILLLDADFRKPTQHKTFEIDKGLGLSSVLAGQQTLADAVRQTQVPGLHVLPCGPVPSNPSEILNSQMFADILAELAERFDSVLIDSPPIMPVTDARILAANCDATVIALRAERSTRRAAVHARDVLRSVGARLIGVVVNDVPRRKGLYGYYYSDAELYRYGYGHGSAARRNVAAPAGASAPATPAIAGNGAPAHAVPAPATPSQAGKSTPK